MWVVLALCILIALTALVLSIPVDLNARVEVHGRPIAYLRVEWLFGRLSREFRTGARGSHPAKSLDEEQDRKQKAHKKQGKGKKGRDGVRLAWQLLTTPGLVRSVARMVRRLLHCIRIRLLAVDFRVDLGDPADTAMFVGAVSQVALLADLCSPYSFRIMPAFFGDALVDGEAGLSVRLRPICSFPPVLVFVCSPSTLRAIVRVIRWRSEREG